MKRLFLALALASTVSIISMDNPNDPTPQLNPFVPATPPQITETVTFSSGDLILTELSRDLVLRLPTLKEILSETQNKQEIELSPAIAADFNALLPYFSHEDMIERTKKINPEGNQAYKDNAQKLLMKLSDAQLCTVINASQRFECNNISEIAIDVLVQRLMKPEQVEKCLKTGSFNLTLTGDASRLVAAHMAKISAGVPYWMVKHNLQNRILLNFSENIYNVCLSPSGDRAAIAFDSPYQKLAVHDTQTGSLLCEIENAGGIQSVTFTGNEKYLVGIGINNTLYVYDAKTGILVHQLENLFESLAPRNKFAFTIAAQPDTSIIAIGMFDEQGLIGPDNANILLIMDVENGKKIREIRTNQVTALTMSPDGKCIHYCDIYGNFKTNLVTIDLAGSSTKNFLPMMKVNSYRGFSINIITSLESDKNNTHIIMRDVDGALRIFDCKTGTITAGNDCPARALSQGGFGGLLNLTHAGFMHEGIFILNGLDRNLYLHAANQKLLWTIIPSNLGFTPEPERDINNTIYRTLVTRQTILAYGLYKQLCLMSLTNQKLQRELTPEQVTLLNYCADCAINERSATMSNYPGISIINEKLPLASKIDFGALPKESCTIS